VAQGPLQFVQTCRQCKGSGRSSQRPCAPCAGEGRISRHEKLKVKIPAGVEDGAKIRLAGKGEAGRKGGPSGDLYIQVKVRPHVFLRRKGLDLEYDLPLTVPEAIRGGQIDIPTLEGAVQLKIPASVQSGTRLRLKGKGIRSKEGTGDLHVRIQVLVPDQATEDAGEIADKLTPYYSVSVRKNLHF
jgi:molecular chaperone DnaJ